MMASTNETLAAVRNHDPADAPAHWHTPRVQPVPASSELTIPLRYSAGPKLGDEASARAADEAKFAARKAQRVKYEVVPGGSVTALDGRLLSGGTEVVLSDVGDTAVLSELVRLGAISALTDVELAARTTVANSQRRYQINPARRGSLIGKSRMLEPGEFVDASDFAGQVGEPAQAEIPATLNLAGVVIPGRPATAARPTVTPEETLARLVKRGLVVDLAPSKGKST